MHESESEVTQSCPTLSDPMDCSLPGSSVHGIFQARVLEWGAILLAPFILKVKERLRRRYLFKGTKLIRNGAQDFPGGPVAKYPCSQFRGPKSDPWSEN